MKKLLSILFGSMVVFAAEPPATQETPTSGWFHSAEASLLLTSGNTSVSTIGGSFESHYKGPIWSSKARVSFVQNSVSGTTQAELFTLDGRADRAIDRGYSVYLQGGFLRNPFAGFNSRTVADIGLRNTVVLTENQTLAAEAGFGLVAENRTDIGSNTFANVKVSIDYQWKISPTADFSNLLTVMENLRTASDFRLSNLASLSLIITEILSTKIGFRLDYLNAPVAGKKNLDTATTLALVAKF